MELTEDQLNRLETIFPQIRSGVAPNHDVKIQMVVLNNELFGTFYKPTTNCGTCLNDCFQNMKRLAKLYGIK